MVTNDGTGLSLSRPGERSDSPINYPLEDRPGEFADGTSHWSVPRHSTPAMQHPTQQGAQPHTVSLNSPPEGPLRNTSVIIHTNGQNPTNSNSQNPPTQNLLPPDETPRPTGSIPVLQPAGPPINNNKQQSKKIKKEH